MVEIVLTVLTGVTTTLISLAVTLTLTGVGVLELTFRFFPLLLSFATSFSLILSGASINVAVSPTFWSFLSNVWSAVELFALLSLLLALLDDEFGTLVFSEFLILWTVFG